jgi:hypothetical protein
MQQEDLKGYLIFRITARGQLEAVFVGYTIIYTAGPLCISSISFLSRLLCFSCEFVFGI